MVFNRKKYYKDYYKKNKKCFLGYIKKYQKSEKGKEKIKQWVNNHRGKINEYHRKRYNNRDEKTIDQRKEYHQKWYLENKIRIRESRKEYRQTPEAIEKRRRRERNYRKNQEICIKQKLRVYLWRIKNKSSNTRKSRKNKYGINYQAIINHLKPFPENMSLYDFHHNKPLFTFNFINEDGSTNIGEIQKAFSPENHMWVLRELHNQINHKNLI